jgi:hypothetical protein
MIARARPASLVRAAARGVEALTITTTAATMTAIANIVQPVTLSPATAQPSSTATTGFT